MLTQKYNHRNLVTVSTVTGNLVTRSLSQGNMVTRSMGTGDSVTRNLSQESFGHKIIYHGNSVTKIYRTKESCSQEKFEPERTPHTQHILFVTFLGYVIFWYQISVTFPVTEFILVIKYSVTIFHCDSISSVAIFKE